MRSDGWGVIYSFWKVLEKGFSEVYGLGGVTSHTKKVPEAARPALWSNIGIFRGPLRVSHHNLNIVGHRVGAIAGATRRTIKNGGHTSESSLYVLFRNTRVGGMTPHQG